MFIIALALATSQGVTMSGNEKAKTASHAATAAVECPAFKKNADGSWTSIRNTKVGAVAMSAGGTFFPGVKLDGVDVGASLDAKCGVGTHGASGKPGA